MKKAIVMLYIFLSIVCYAENFVYLYGSEIVNKETYKELTMQEENTLNSGKVIGFIDDSCIDYKQIFTSKDLIFADTRIYKSYDDYYIEINSKGNQLLFRLSSDSMLVVSELPERNRIIQQYDLHRLNHLRNIEMDFDGMVLSADKSGARCMDTAISDLRIKNDENIVLELKGFGNLSIVCIEGSSNENEGFIVINTHGCSGICEIFLLKSINI
ncbi:MAG: hypothetical protein JXB49_05720 [Bacteroidales bacterium]|nr:hypothetical protein [Bacteroidales bacterium]